MENNMSINLAEDIRSVTDLKRNTREILDQIHLTKRPVVLTVNGRADAVIMDVEVYEKQLKAANLARLLAPAEEEAATGKTRPTREFINEFKNSRKIQR
jgi:prevent-host-death family protein